MNEDEVAEGCVPPAEMDFFENTSKRGYFRIHI